MSMNSFHARTARPKPKPVGRAVADRHGEQRADALLVERDLATSRAAAQRLIAAGRVYWKVGAGATAQILKPAQLLPPAAVLHVLPDDAP